MCAASVAIRVDSGAHIGSGHLMRCLTLAGELRQRGAQVSFVSREHDGHLIDQVEDAAYIVHRLPGPASASTPAADRLDWLGVAQRQDAGETVRALGGQRYDWLVVDHYGIDAEWEKSVRTNAERVMVIDDLADRLHDSDLLLNQNYLSTTSAHRYVNRVPEHCRCMLGPRYALLQPIYRQLRQVLPARDGSVRRILVFFGAHDATRSIVAVLHALQRPEFAGIAIDAVPGSDPETAAVLRSVARNHPNVMIHERLPSLAGLIARADLGIGAGGATTWERACLGLPSVVATTADNQVEIARALAADGFIIFVGSSTMRSSEMWQSSLAEVLGDREQLIRLGRRARGLTDGYGASRVARAMIAEFKMVIRPVAHMDEFLLFEWANDPATRRFSFSNSQITEDEHHNWFVAKVADPTCTILIGEDPEGLPLGQVRFETNVARREATVHVSVEPGLRGTGIGIRLLCATVSVWRSRAPDFTIVAEVLADNDASKRLFLAANFETGPPRRLNSVVFRLRPDVQVGEDRATG
jgi:UDP-2,4-diacetamido-2,4,6-trideoxy-beta-L-altropyranose hydrolase